LVAIVLGVNVHALKQLLKKKQHGEKIERPEERGPSNVVNLMDALRKSVEESKGGAKREPAAKKAAHPKKRSAAKHKKAG
jgi:DNA end-binding protein Ku